MVFSVLGFLILGISGCASENIGVSAAEPLLQYYWTGPFYVWAAARSDGYDSKTFIGFQSACGSPTSVYPTGSSYTWYPAEWHPEPLYMLSIHIYNPNPYAIEVTYWVQCTSP